jgi:hypothetical protein
MVFWINDVTRKDMAEPFQYDAPEGCSGCFHNCTKRRWKSARTQTFAAGVWLEIVMVRRRAFRNCAAISRANKRKMCQDSEKGLENVFSLELMSDDL